MDLSSVHAPKDSIEVLLKYSVLSFVVISSDIVIVEPFSLVITFPWFMVMFHYESPLEELFA